MIQYNKLNVKLFTSQLNKLKSTVKNGTEKTLKSFIKFVWYSNDGTNFPHK